MSLMTEIMNRLSSQSVGGLTSTATWRIVGRDFLPGSIGGSTQAQQICVTPTGGFDQEQVDSLTYPTFQLRIRGNPTGSTGLEAKCYEAVNALNLSGRYLPYGTLYTCTDTSGSATGSLLGNAIVTAAGTATLTCTVIKGTATQSRIGMYVVTPGTYIIDATVTWSGSVPSVAMTAGTLVSSTQVADGPAYQLVMTGTILGGVGVAYRVATFPDTSATSGTGTLHVGAWALTNLSFTSGDTADMTTWTATNATAAELRDVPTYLDINQQGDLLYLGRDAVQRPLYAANFVAFRSRTT